MNTIVQDFPSPLERKPMEGKAPGSDEAIERQADGDEPFSALVFKTVADPFAGKLNILRVMSGTITSDSVLYNINTETKEKFGQILILEGKKQQPVDEAVPGDIIAFAKLKTT